MRRVAIGALVLVVAVYLVLMAMVDPAFALVQGLVLAGLGLATYLVVTSRQRRAD